MSSTKTPSIAVVVASAAGGEFLFRCLRSLATQADVSGAPIVVVDRTGEATRSRLRREFPQVRVIETPPGERATVPHMRRLGAQAVSTDLVAVLEEHCTAPPGWLSTAVAAFQDADAAIGGPILDDAYENGTDWCVYFSEYHNYLPPWPDGDRFDLNGANIVYRRALLLRHADVLDSGYWEVVLHPLLAREGRFRAVNALGVPHTGPFGYAYYLRQRYLLSRVWGGSQRALVPWSRRLVHLVAGPVFPAFLFARVTSRVMARRDLLPRYLRTLPLLVPAWCAYAAGEWLGYGRARAGPRRG
jgi:hypothetical protein